MVENVNVLNPIAEVSTAFRSIDNLFFCEILIIKGGLDSVKVLFGNITSFNFRLEILKFFKEFCRVLELGILALPWITTWSVKSSLFINRD
jgi:hypothetical protein